MRRKSHVRFLGGDGAAMCCPYPPDIRVEAFLFPECSDPSHGQPGEFRSQIQEGEFTSPIAMLVAA